MIRPAVIFKKKEAAEKVATGLFNMGAVANVSEERDRRRTLFALNVDEPDHGKAFAFVEENELGDDAIPCPECGSIAVEFPARARASGTLHAVEAIVDAIAPAREHQFQCRGCAHTW